MFPVYSLESGLRSLVRPHAFSALGNSRTRTESVRFGFVGLIGFCFIRYQHQRGCQLSGHQ